jgi:hypothetical protein
MIATSMRSASTTRSSRPSSIVVEINVPFGGRRRDIAGAFAADD